MTGEQLANFYADLCTNYPLITIEDPFDQETRRLLFESESNKLASIGVVRWYFAPRDEMKSKGNIIEDDIGRYWQN